MTRARGHAALSLLAPVLVVVAAPVAAARDVPSPQYPVRDDMGLLDQSTRVHVERECVAVERETGAQIGVLITDTTGGEDPNAFAHRVLNHWGVGQRDRGNGVLLLFAMRDRRIELAPGWEYEALFNEGASKRLLALAVPHMRSGRPAEGVLGVVRAVAEQIRQQEALTPVAADLAAGYVETDAFNGGSDRRPAGASVPGEVPAASSMAPTTTPKAKVKPTRTSAPARTLPGSSSFTGQTFMRGVVVVLLLVWAAGLIFALYTTFTTGNLVLSPGVIIALALLVPVALGAFMVFTTRGGINAFAPVDWGIGAGGLIGGIVMASLTSHICPCCSKWMSIHSRTLVYPTYYSSGTGQRTYDCRHCSYHRVETYTISRKTRSHSSSSRSSFGSSSRSSSGGGGSSFGGGSSRGGGGGVSW